MAERMKQTKYRHLPDNVVPNLIVSNLDGLQ